MKKRYIVLASILIVVFAILLIGFLTIQLDPARPIYEEGQSFQQMLEFDLALSKYQEVLNKHPDSFFAPKAVDSMSECYYEWGEKLQEEQDYETALEKYQIVVDEFPQSECADAAYHTIPECCYEWGLCLQREKKYSEALEKYQLIIDEYSSSPYEPLEYESKAEEAIPECYYEWVSELVTEKKHEDALQKYFIIIESFSDSVWASHEMADVLKNVPAETLFTSASKLQQQKLYEIALRLYDVIIEYHPDSAYAAEAEKAKIDIEVSRVAEEKHGDLPDPAKPDRKELEGKVELTVVNDTPYKLTILISGPTTTSVTIEPSPGSHEYSIKPFFGPPEDARRRTVELEPGAYELVAKVDEPDVIPYYGEETFEGNNQYEYWLYVYKPPF